jgi:hypothetical protein
MTLERMESELHTVYLLTLLSYGIMIVSWSILFGKKFTRPSE